MKKTLILKGILFTFVVTGVILYFSGSNFAAPPLNVDKKGVALKGYDPVAYFTVGKPVKGNQDFAYEWKGAKWWFSSKEHRTLFTKDPERYVPQYGGYCAYGVAVNGLFDVEPDAWKVYEGKLYLNKDKKVQGLWSKDIPGYIQKADMNWPGVLNK